MAASRDGQSAEAEPEAGLDLRQAIAALPPRRRACVVLRYLGGMTEAQTAQVLGITPGTVKSQTHKALRQLRQQLAEPVARAGQTRAAEGDGS